MDDDLTLETAAGLGTDDLLAGLRSAQSCAEGGLRRACVFAAVLEERGVDLPMLPPVFRHARQIAEGRLSAHAAWILVDDPFVIRAIAPLPPDLQDRLADGEQIKIAVQTAQGRVVSAERKIFEMTRPQMQRAFDDGRILDWTRQGELLIKGHNAAPDGAPPRLPRVKIDPETQMITVNGVKVPDELLIAAFAAKGMQVKPIYARPIRAVRG